MTSRERLLAAINNQKPDRLPCQVHSWMPYYLENYLDGIDQWDAYERFGFDFVIYNNVEHIFDEKDKANWQQGILEQHTDSSGVKTTTFAFKTPEGTLQLKQGANEYTVFDKEHLLKDKEDFEIFAKYWPVPVELDYSQVVEDKERLGDKGIMRTYGLTYMYGQPSPWQSLCFLMGTQQAIMAAMDDPKWVHYALETIVEKSLRVIELAKDCPIDLIEIGGGAASNTVISPAMFEEFVFPYERRQVKAIHDIGGKVVYHLCGGMMKMADLVIKTGADGLETMTPKSMGGDCDLALASEKWGDKLFFVGGFDQNAGFENGIPDDARRLVRECFEATKEQGGYIIAPSDHFFHGDPANIQAFVDEVKKCTYV